MKSIIACAAFVLVLGGVACAQDTGPAPQTGMEKPAMTNGAKEDGKMDTTGMSAAKGNVKRERDGAPAKPDVKK
ncbi:hypothetical protein ABID58_006097 [Bradyrhizobium sp. S3.2.6]|uniref:hypothetical protein n=1 Tax=Bradyrhizobium sp. S3.2.6 TaxID=3156428 RepID=UPI003393031E